MKTIKTLFISMIIIGSAVAAIGQKPTPKPKPATTKEPKTIAAVFNQAENDQRIDLSKKLKDLVKQAETGFKAIKGTERDTNTKSLFDPVDRYDRFASKIKLDDFAAQEILESTFRGDKEVMFVAYYPDNNDPRRAFDQLFEKIKTALGEGYVSTMTYVADDIDDEREGKAAEFSLKNVKKVLLKVELVDDLTSFDIVRTHVRLVVPGTPQR